MADSSGDQQEAAISSSKALSATTHPLQDIALNMDEEGDLFDDVPSQQQPPQKAANKQNWVKFDDESTEKNNQNDGNKITTPTAIDSADNATRATTATTSAAAAAAAATATTTTNKLSPIPPPVAKRQTPRSVSPTTTNTTGSSSGSGSVLPRPRTPVESGNMPPQQQAAAAAPVQRAAVSSSTSMADVAPAVLNTESTHVNLNASGRTQHQSQHQQQHHPHSQQQQHQKPKSASGAAATQSSSQHTQLPHHSNNGTSSSAMHKSTNVAIPVESAPGMRTIELSTGRIREGFANGDVIVTLLPANTKWPWITPAIFRPELVPEELMAQGLTLTVEEYVNAMETLVNDYRFTVYNICYKRILVCWILFAFAVLLTLLFSGLQGVALFSLGVGWLFLNAAAIFVCMWMKLRLSRGLEKCLARVNRQLMKHKILLILDDRGRISCHKVNLCFLYFDSTQCVNFLNEFLEHTEQNGGEAIKAGWESKLDIDVNDIVIQGNNPVRLSRKQERGTQLYLRYGSRWGMEALRGLVDVTPLEPGRHCGQFQCPCQYIKEHLQCKPRGKFKCFNFIHWVLASERYDP